MPHTGFGPLHVVYHLQILTKLRLSSLALSICTDYFSIAGFSFFETFAKVLFLESCSRNHPGL